MFYILSQALLAGLLSYAKFHGVFKLNSRSNSKYSRMVKVSCIVTVQIMGLQPNGLGKTKTSLSR